MLSVKHVDHMAMIKREIAKQAKGSLAEREDWWRLCYDTHSREFFVEHEWHHMDAYKSDAPSNEGTERHDVEGYDGMGSENLEGAMAELLAEAGHA
jgi:hypothetical protein